ncbi:Zn-dependent oxidoreductase [Lacihabitans sp. LS3-19]|uniref:zinc-binding dehydrogenase n=1 Tax=Lacihabitans sp. LS3-19 TaxID=2487335 RepID=UPI0020CC779C|nr:zinc-binding dehydrogenase [Lacihabitans sp. LS3-19]MCP9767756.1 Zn-dependent oxidoreductase [Lacihabitans sp. LS3-19]
MKALLCTEFGPAENLKYSEIVSPEPKENEIVIQIAACSANFPDTLIIENKYQFKPNLPFSPGGEVAGKIVKLGENVSNFQIGQRVFALCGWGGFAEEVCVGSDRVFPLPDYMNYVDGASLMYNFGTSYHALKNRAKLQAGERVLILGASGGVGLAAVELAKLMGAVVIAAASTDEKLEICKEKGADFTINYDKEDIREKIKEYTQNKGIDVVYDPVGDKYAEPALRSMAWNGRYLVVGFAAGEIPKLPFNLALLKGCSVVGVFWGQFSNLEPKESQENIMELANWYKEGKIKPHVFKTYTLENSAEALVDLRERKVIGKAVVVCNAELVKESLVFEKKEEKSKRIFRDFEEIKAAVGEVIGESNWLKITQNIINDFAKSTFDQQWIHVNPSMAAQTPFGSTIAHGLLTLSLSPRFLNEIYEVKNSKMGINYGSDKVRFLKPVKVNSKLKMVAKILEVIESANNGLKMKVEATYFVENNPNPVCVAELLSVIY